VNVVADAVAADSGGEGLEPAPFRTSLAQDGAALDTGLLADAAVWSACYCYPIPARWADPPSTPVWGRQGAMLGGTGRPAGSAGTAFPPATPGEGGGKVAGGWVGVEGLVILTVSWGQHSTCCHPHPRGGDMTAEGLAGCDTSLCGRRGLLSMGVSCELDRGKQQTGVGLAAKWTGVSS
jgi:hypothetical protein